MPISARPRSVEFCLNLEGRGAIESGHGAPLDYLPKGSAHAIEFIARVAPNMPDMFAVVTVRASVS